jgi:glutathione S-transferase
MVPQPKFFYYPISHYCVSTERMLAFKGIRPTLIRVPYHDKRSLLEATGQDYVPAMVWDEEVVLWDSIPDFVEGRVPKPTLYPGSQRGLARTVENWAHQVLEERVWRAVVTEVPPILDEGVERWVFEELQTRARGPWSVLVARREEFTKELQTYFGYVEEMLADRPWILGEPSRADFGVYGALSPWRTVGHEFSAEFPRIRAWSSRIAAL